jgi:endonuclease/exonuclease/phosphatase family metal-dependent hydrolase
VKRFNQMQNDIAKRLKKKYKAKKGKKNKSAKSDQKSISIASWNLQNLSVNASDEKIDSINKYLRQLFYFQLTDIVFLQELKESQGNSVFEDKLKTYGYITKFSKPLGANNHKEIYAILIHPKMLTKLGGKVPIIKEIKLRSYKQFKRPPYGVVIGNDLILLNVHIGHYGNGSGAKIKRLKEVKELKKQVVQLMRRYRTNHVIIAGDFNLNDRELKSVFGRLGGKYRFNISTKGLTTSSNSYDHVITTMSLKSDLVSWIDRTGTSDHSPIRVKVDLDQQKKKR